MENSKEMYKVLIIDDEHKWARNIGQWLKKSFPDLEVVVAFTGKEGLDEAEKAAPDVFIVDILLPDMNGLQLTRLLKSSPAYANIPIVLMTIMQSDERLLFEALEAGADLYLQKPFEPAELQEVISRCLDFVNAHKVLLNKQNEVDNLRWSLRQMSRGSSIRPRHKPFFEQRALRAMQMFESAPDAIAITLADGIILEVNNMLCEYSGYSKYELVGNHFSILFSDAQLQKHPFEKFRVLSGEVVENERRIRQKSGFEFPVWMKSMLLPDGTVVSFLRDITQIRQTEQELKRQRAFSQNITDKIPNIVYVHDLRKRRNIYINRSVALQLGYPPEVLTDEDDDFLEKVIHPDDYGMFDNFYASANLDDPDLIFHFEYRMKTFAGEWRWFKGYERVWEHQNGKINMLIGSVLDITSEKEKEEAIKRSERNYRELMEPFRTLADNMPDMLWAKDVNKRFIFVNQSICQNLLHAKDIDEPIGKTDLYFAERIKAERPDDPEYHNFGKICQDSDEVIIQTKQPGQFDEFGNVKGKFLYLDVIKAPIFDEHGELVAIVGAGRDITDRKRQEKFLSIQHAVAEALVTSDSLKSLIMSIEKELNSVVDTSNFYVALINESSGKLYTPYLKDEKDDIREWDIEGSATGLVIKTGKLLHLRGNDIEEFIKSGKLISIGSVSSAWLGAPLICNDEIVGALVLQSYHDANAFDDQDVELLGFLANQLGVYIQRMKALDQNRLLSLAVEQSPAGVMITNAFGRLLYTNKRFIEISGYDMSILSALNPEVLMQMFDNESVVDEIYQHIRAGKGWSNQLQLTRPDKSKVWLSISLASLFNDAGKITNWLVIIEDNTEKQKMVDDLIEARDKAEESDRLKSAFLMNISHEIRTPLNSIMGFADLLAGQTTNPEEVRKQGALIYKNGHRLLNLINNILKISKIDAGAETLSLTVFSPAKLIEEVVSLFSPQASKRGLELSAVVSSVESSLMVEADRLKIHQVIDNLVGNALKFTEKGSIKLGFEVGDGKLKFFVSDTGRGIPQSEYGKIFERFYQADTSLNRGYEGVGLGLAICRSMVNLMGGKIWVDSVEGKGSEFMFEIPVRFINAEPENVLTNQLPQQWEKHSKESKTIMVVDDDEPSLLMMKAMLSSAGYKALFASGGYEALDLLKQNPEISLILLDIKMPVLDGMETLKQIRQMGINAVIVATTAYALPGDEQRIRQSGFDDYISKPINRTQIVNLLNKHLHH